MECLTHDKLYDICSKIYNDLYKKELFVQNIQKYINGKQTNKISYEEIKVNDNITNEMILMYQIYNLAILYNNQYINSQAIFDITDEIIILVHFFELFATISDSTNLRFEYFMTYYCRRADDINETLSPQRRIVFSEYMKMSFQYISANDDFLYLGRYMSPVMYFRDNLLIKKREHNRDDVFRNEIVMYKLMQKQSNNFGLYVSDSFELCGDDKFTYFAMHWDTMLQPFIYIDYKKDYVNAILQVIDNLRRLNFYHGDFKCNNIMINISTLEVQIIDLEYSCILQGKNEITWYNVVLNYYDHEDDSYCDRVTYFSDRIMYLYDMYKFVVSLCYNIDEVWNDFKYSKGIVQLDYLVFTMLCSNDDIQYVTSICDMKDLFVCLCTIPKLQNHYNEMKKAIYEEVIRNEP